MTKRYDRAYFDRWYRNRSTRVSTREEVRRKVAVAIAITEYHLRRQLRTVLDVGCGEGAWLAHLRSFRPRVQYTGLDPSEYVVERFGKERNIRQAAFGEVQSLKLGVFDLVVCSDVLHYVPDAELRAGIAGIASACDGVAYLEVLTKEDDVTGDMEGFLHRPANWYRRVFTSAGLTFAGPYCWLAPPFRDAVAELEAFTLR